MFVEELDAALIDAFGNVLADLVRRPALDHVESSPTVLRLSAGRRADEESVLELALQPVLLNVVGQEGRNLPARGVKSYEISIIRASSKPRSEEAVLGIANAREAGPADVGAIGEVVKKVLGLAELFQQRGPVNARLKRGRSDSRHVDMRYDHSGSE